MSFALVIAGMHRSGTSLVTGLLARAGLHVGSRILQAGASNPRGFHEDQDFVDFHEKALRDRGQTILVDAGFRFEATADEMARARRLIEDRGSRPVWGWKDPRTSLFLEFWDSLLDAKGYLFLYRHPVEVAFSLLRRGEPGMAALAEGVEAWTLYNRAIKGFSERHPGRFVLCEARTAVARYGSLLDLLNRRFGLALQGGQADADAAFRPGEFQALTMREDLAAAFGRLYPESAALYAELDAAADMPASAGAVPPLSTDAARFSEFVAGLSPQAAAGMRRGLLLALLGLLDAGGAERGCSRISEAVRSLQTGKDWLEIEYTTWKALAEERERMLAVQKAWIAELERAKEWLDGQRLAWQKLAEEREGLLARQSARTAKIETASLGSP
jgi:hypothetical protein